MDKKQQFTLQHKDSQQKAEASELSEEPTNTSGTNRRAAGFTIQDLPAEERPRERLQNLGPAALSGQELLALILGSGASGESVLETAQQLLSMFVSLAGVVNASLEELQQIRGLGPAQATKLAASLEIARRVIASEQADETARREGKPVTSPEQVYELLRGKIRNYRQEHFIVASFNSRDRLLGVDTVSVGTVDASVIHPREIFANAIRRHASYIIVAHNHPSGDPTPSTADEHVTRRLTEAGKVMNIEVRDHLIIGHNTFFSFKEGS